MSNLGFHFKCLFQIQLFFYKVFELYTEIMGAFTDKIILCCYFFVTFKEIFRSVVICLQLISFNVGIWRKQ